MTTKLTLIIFVLALLAGCAGQSTAPTPAPIGGDAAALSLDLPNPAALLAQLHPTPHGASLAKFTEADVEQLGNMNSPALPYQHVANNGTALRFIPDLGPGGVDTFDGLSYATYHFELPFYDRNPEVRLKWKVPPQSAGDYFVAAANWAKDRWDWRAGTDTGRISFGTLAPYKSFSDDIVVLVAVIGTEDVQLDSVRIGGLAPVAALSVDEPLGATPFLAKLDASGSTDPDGLSLSYEYDFDGDGIFDSVDGLGPQVEYSYSSNGDYQPAVRVTNSIHASSVASVDVHAISEWSRSFGSSGQDALKDVAIDLDGYIYAVGDFDLPEYNLLITKWTPTGDLVWAKQWDSGEPDYGVNLAFDTNFNLIVGGQTDKNGVRQALVQKYTRDGDNVWSKRFGSATKSTMLMSLKVASDGIYCGGQATINSNVDLFAARLDLDGELEWMAYRDTGVVDVFEDMVLPYAVFPGDSIGVALLGGSQIGGGSNLWKVRIDADGSFVSSHQFGTSAEPKFNGKFAFTNDFFEGVHYYVVGETTVGAQPQFFMLKADGDGNNIWGKRYAGLDLQPHFLSFRSDGNLLAGCAKTPAGTPGISLIKMTPGGVDLGAYTLTSGAGTLSTWGMHNLAGGVVLAGVGVNSTSIPAHPQMPSPSSFYHGFQTLSTNGGLANYVSTDTTLDAVTDVTQNGVLNTGAGAYDSLLTWRKNI